MPLTACAVHLGAYHSVRAVGRCFHSLFERRPETRPAGTAFELGRRGEQVLSAPGTSEDTVPVLLVERTCPSPFGPVLAQNVILLWRQPRAPRLVARRNVHAANLSDSL